MWAAVASALALAATNVVNNRVLTSPLYNLNPDLEMTPWSWASSSLTFGAAMAVLATVLVGAAPRRLLALAGILAYFSLDDAIEIHERAARWLVSVGVPDGIDGTVWPALFLPLFAGAFLLLLDIGSSAPAGARRMIVVGLGLLIFAVASEAVWGLWYASGGGDAQSWPNTIEVALEEGAELAAWMLICAALMGLALHAAAATTPQTFSGFVDSVALAVRPLVNATSTTRPPDLHDPVTTSISETEPFTGHGTARSSVE